MLQEESCDQKMHYDAADDPARWREETPEREALFDKMQKIREILRSREPEQPKEPKPRFIPGAAKTRMMPREVNEQKMKFREDGTFEKLLGDLNNPRNQTRTATFYIKFGALPTEAEFGADWLHQGDGEMSPFPFKPSEHPDLEGVIWDMSG